MRTSSTPLSVTKRGHHCLSPSISVMSPLICPAATPATTSAFRRTSSRASRSSTPAWPKFPRPPPKRTTCGPTLATRCTASGKMISPPPCYCRQGPSWSPSSRSPCWSSSPTVCSPSAFKAPGDGTRSSSSRCGIAWRRSQANHDGRWVRRILSQEPLRQHVSAEADS